MQVWKEHKREQGHFGPIINFMVEKLCTFIQPDSCSKQMRIRGIPLSLRKISKLGLISILVNDTLI